MNKIEEVMVHLNSANQSLGSAKTALDALQDGDADMADFAVLHEAMVTVINQAEDAFWSLSKAYLSDNPALLATLRRSVHNDVAKENPAQAQPKTAEANPDQEEAVPDQAGV